MLLNRAAYNSAAAAIYAPGVPAAPVPATASSAVAPSEQDEPENPK